MAFMAGLKKISYFRQAKGKLLIMQSQMFNVHIQHTSMDCFSVSAIIFFSDKKSIRWLLSIRILATKISQFSRSISSRFGERVGLLKCITPRIRQKLEKHIKVPIVTILVINDLLMEFG